MTRILSGIVILFSTFLTRADGPGDNLADKVRPVPPRGIDLSPADRQELAAGVEALGKEINALRETLKKKPALLELLPDVQIFHNAVRYALAHNEFHKPAEVGIAKKHLETGRERARLLRDGLPSWSSEPGLIVRGYVSKIDGSVQPYGLVVPNSYKWDSPHRHRLDVWFHGRGETLSEVNFLNDRQKNPGQFTPPDAFVLHPYGRYCNANHFAGEIDTFEALDHIRKHYRIDDDRLVVRGFSMGGAACWNFAVHYPGLWAAAAPGAGFSETPDFLKVFQQEKLEPPAYERKLWHMYDCTDWAINLFHCPTVAYSGEKDKQKQAADVMATAMKAEGLDLVHIIGPGMGHAYHPAAKKEIDARVDAIAARGRDPLPRNVRFTTWTLRYNRLNWVVVDGLEKHWERARVNADIVDASTVKVATTNVTALTLSMPPGLCPLDNTKPATVILDGTSFAAPVPLSDRSWNVHFRKSPTGWTVVADAEDNKLRKRHGLQGPIDDAFMDSFLMVSPTGMPVNEKVGTWTTAEMKHALDHWRKQFRGEARVKKDVDVSKADIAEHNLVLWGDTQSNKVLAQIAAKLPIAWTATDVKAGGKSFPSGNHVPVLIYPNPLNPKKYIVLNSGFTFREYDYLNNARQVPKLPDWAILDISQPRTSRSPAGIVAAGFFGEKWELTDAK